MTVFAVAIVAVNSVKYQSFIYGSFVWEIHMRYNNEYLVIFDLSRFSITFFLLPNQVDISAHCSYHFSTSNVLRIRSGFPHNREKGKSPGIRYWSFTAMKSPGISTFGDLSRELSGKICSLAYPQRHSYAWMLNLVYQLFFREKMAQL